MSDMAPGVDTDESSLSERRTDLQGYGVELQLHGVTQLERRGDRQWPIREARVRSEERDTHPILGDVPECKGRFERGDATPGDEHSLLPAALHVTTSVVGVTSTIAHARPTSNRESRGPSGVFYGSAG
jgi:hypothetical protein